MTSAMPSMSRAPGRFSTPRTQTLPVAMYNYVREFADPSMAALSVMYIAATAVLIVFANLFLGLGKVLNIEQSR